MKILTPQVQVREARVRQPSIVLCLLLDFIGYASYSIPLLVELADLFWAPLSSAIFLVLFGGWGGGIGGMLNFIEEILPGTDFIPSFTIMWFIRNNENKNRGTDRRNR